MEPTPHLIEAALAYARATEPGLSSPAWAELNETLQAKYLGDVEEIAHAASDPRASLLPRHVRLFVVAQHLFEVVAPSHARSPFLSAEPRDVQRSFLRRVQVALDVLDPRTTFERSAS